MRPLPFYQSMKVELLQGHSTEKGGVLQFVGEKGDVLSYDAENPNASAWSARDLILMTQIGVAKFVEV
jgi:hypothetical protein